MIATSSNTPLEAYHGVPAGCEAREPGCHHGYHDRFNWLQYKATLYKISEDVKLGDKGCTELAIQYIELNYFGSYSGLIRERLARALKTQMLQSKQIATSCY